jgi:site-specific DNA recombinase
MKYFLYARKSSDSEDRQVLSIESQLKELRDFASKEGLEVVKEFSESRTAKEPGRPVFNQMLLEIEQGEAQGIIAWHPDRCARNSIDGGKIIHLIDQKIITDLKFPTYIYDSSPHGIFNLSLAFSFSKLYVDNLSQNVKRGIREKLRRGEYPGPAPRGYINNLKTHTIEADPRNFDLIKTLMTKFADNEITIPEIRKKLFEAKITSRSGKPIYYSTIKDMLANTFYYGVFKLNGELHQGTHPAMISKETHDKIQKRLKLLSRKRSKAERRKLDRGFLFSELGKCGECGYSLIHDFHHRKHTGKSYKYYRCSKKSPIHKCKDKPIREEELTPQIESLTKEIALNDDWYEYSLGIINSWKAEEEKDSHSQVEELKNELQANKAKLEKLLDLQLEGGIEIEEYKTRKNKFVNQNTEIQGQIKKINTQGSLWFEFLESALKTSNQAHHRVLNKDHSGAFEILQKAGSNSKLHQKQYSLTFNKPFCFFREVLTLTDMCSSPKNCPSMKKLETQLISSVKENEGALSASHFSYTACHEPFWASGARRAKPAGSTSNLCKIGN